MPRRFTYRVAINLARSHLRKHLRVLPSGLGTGHERSTEPPPSEDWVVVASALAHLSGRQRACVVLVDYVGFDAAGAGAAPTSVARPSSRGGSPSLTVTEGGDTSTIGWADVATGDTASLPIDDPFAAFPVWSPDRSRIAYVTFDPDADALTLHVAEPDGSGDRVLAGAGVRYAFAWSPGRTRGTDCGRSTRAGERRR